MNIFNLEKINNQITIELHGTNGWFETANGSTSCIGVYTSKCNILFDIGTGFKNVSPIKTKGKPLSIFLSHLHFDHIYGIHILGLHKPSNVKIFLPQKLMSEFKLIAKPPFVKDLTNLGFPVEICGIEAKEYKEDHFIFEAIDIVHNTDIFAYKIKINDKSICYCVDTKSCNNAYSISQNSDVLICDSALKIDESSEGKYHMNMQEAALIAKESKVKLLVLTHFGALRYRTIQERFDEAKSIEAIFKNHIVGTDNLVINL
jgi:ribonuclease BN (tRNA processing enzyme)